MANTASNWKQFLVIWAANILALFCVAPLTAVAQTTITPPSIESFFENNVFGGAVLSPNGYYLAVRTNKGKRDFLAVIDLDTKVATWVAGHAEADIGHFQWVSNNRLVYDLRDTTLASGDQENAPGLYAINRDGTKFIQLADRGGRRIHPQPWNTFLLDQHGSQDSEWIYVRRPMYDDFDKYFGTRLRRLNTLTGAAEVASEPDVEVSSFMLDFKGEPRLALSFNDIKSTIHYRDPITDKWRELASYATYTNAKDAIKPLGFGPDGTLYVVANAGEDKSTMRTFDFITGKVNKDALVVTPGYDFDGSLVSDNKVQGVRVTTDAEENTWFDHSMKNIQKAVDKALPTTINLITVPPQPGSPWVLVESYSDMQPSRYALYDTKTGLVDPVGNTYPNIQIASMGRQETVRYKARDGLEIPGLLTLPPDGTRKDLPMVVLVHGGAVGARRQLALESRIPIPCFARLCRFGGGVSR